MTGADLARTALALEGSPFRLHGRDPETGLDCVGVLAAAFTACGECRPLPNGYRLRARELPWLADTVEACGLVPAEGPIEPGDVLLAGVGPCQFHLLVAAGLGRVVVAAANPDWSILHHWRLDSAD